MPSDPHDALEIDVAVVGAGPAGLAAGIHLARLGLEHRVFERDEPGGLLCSAGLVECYPGFPGGIQARELVTAMVSQARGLGVHIAPGEVTDLSWSGAGYQLQMGTQCWLAQAVILATGTTPRLLDPKLFDGALPTERVHHGTASLPRGLVGSRIWVSGGGDAAFDSALQLLERGATVQLAMRGQRPKALALLVQRAQECGVQIHPDTTLSSLRLRPDGLELALATAEGPVTHGADHVVICHGRVPDHLLWHRLASPAARGPRQVESHYPGLFMAGDLVRGECRYAAVAAGDGLRCAKLAELHLERYRARPLPPSSGSP